VGAKSHRRSSYSSPPLAISFFKNHLSPLGIYRVHWVYTETLLFWPRVYTEGVEMADGDIPGKFVQIGLKVPPEFADRLDVFLAGRNRSQFIRDMLEGAMSGGLVLPEPKVVPVSRSRSGGSACTVAAVGLVSQAMAGREVVESADKRRVLDCLVERRRSARDVAVALKMDFGTAGLVIADLVRDGLVRKVTKDGMLELVE
jgi:hypothetical protein